jgi:hypothetical protein
MIFLFDTSFSNADPGQMEMNFKKPREVFSQNKMIYKNLPHILHIYLILRYSKRLLDPIFQNFGRQKVKRTDGKEIGFKGTDHPQIPSKQCQISE